MKAISLALVCLFFVNDIAWAFDSVIARTKSEAISKSATLATQSVFSDPELEKRLALRMAVMPHPAENDYLANQIAREKEILGTKWEEKRTEEISIDDPRARGRIQNKTPELKTIKCIRVAGMFAHTLQFGHVGLRASAMYVDSSYFNKSDFALLKHERDEILLWEDFRANELKINKSQMRQWIKNNITQALELADKFHKMAYPLDELYGLIPDINDKKFLNYINLHTIVELLSRYADFADMDVNIAAKDSFDVSLEIKRHLLRELKSFLAALPEDKVNSLRQINDLGGIREFLSNSGLAQVWKIDGKFLSQEVSEFLRRRPLIIPEKISERRNMLRWAGEGRKLVAYWADDFNFIVKMKRDEEEIKVEDILRQWIGEGCRIASERLNGLAVSTMIINATKGSKKPFSYILEGRGIQKTDLAIIQRKVVPLLDQMKYLIKEGKVSQAQDLVDGYKELIVAMFKRGVIDLDFTYPYNNCGVDPETGKIYVFDFGDLCDNERDVGMYFENLGITNKYFYDDLVNQVSKEVARYFALFPLIEDDFYTPQGELLFGADLKSGSIKSFKMKFSYPEDKIRAIFMSHTMNHSDTKLPPPGSIYSVFEFICDNTTEAMGGITGQEIADRIGNGDDIGRAYSTIDYDIRALLYHLKLIEKNKDDEISRKTGKDARYYVPESVKKKRAQLLPILEQFRRDTLRPDTTLLDKVYNEQIKPIDEYPQKIIQELKDERALIQRMHSKWSPAITIFGSARIPPGDTMYAKAREMGAAIYREGIAIRTGAGPSMMEAPLQGYVEERRRSDYAHGNLKTQGIRIKLPFEQRTSSYVEDNYDVNHFMTRKMGLYNNCLGIVVFPGGFGTMDELFEVWFRQLPTVMIGTEFWKSIMDAFYYELRDRGWLENIELKPLITDSVEEAMKYLRECKGRVIRETPEVMEDANSDIESSITKMSKWRSSVTIIGQSDFKSEKETALIGEITSSLLSQDIPVTGPKTASLQLPGGIITTDYLTIQNTVDIENLLQILNKPVLEQKKQDDIKYYTIRYNAAKISQGSLAEKLLKVYAEQVLPMYLPGKGRVELRASVSPKQSLVSVECYKDQARSESQKIGEGRVDIDEDINGKALRIIGMMNMAFLASHIPGNVPPDEMNKYDMLVSAIKRQYKDISEIDSTSETVQFTPQGIYIRLPRAAKVPLEKIEEYYRLTIIQLEQAA